MKPPTARPSPEPRSAYRYLRIIPTRWMDNDVYGHVNNVTYYSYFDTVVNGYLIERGALDIARSAVIGLVVETHCNYFSPIAFPDAITAGLRVAHRGTSSVRYEIGIFRGDDDTASAQGHFVHVYVDRASGKPVPPPEALQRAVADLMVG
jgi:acyl-CoA thioester hydrolase